MAADPVTLSIGVLAAEFSMTRDILRRILAEAGVGAAGKRGGHPVYRLGAVYQAIQRQADPEHANPHSRLALAKAIEAEDRTRVRRGDLIERDDVRETMAAAFKPIRQTFEILPDTLERDAGLTPSQVSACERVLDGLRDELAKQLADVR